MPRTIIPFNNPKLTLADTLAGVGAGDAYECQLTGAVLVSTANFVTIPQTGCAPASQSPSRSSWALQLKWLQDWTDPGGGLSGFAFDNDTLQMFFALSIDIVGDPTVIAKGELFVVSGAYGGDVGGAPLPAAATWPLLDKPTITFPAAA